jgi:hypothetical protein
MSWPYSFRGLKLAANESINDCWPKRWLGKPCIVTGCESQLACGVPVSCWSYDIGREVFVPNELVTDWPDDIGREMLSPNELVTDWPYDIGRAMLSPNELLTDWPYDIGREMLSPNELLTGRWPNRWLGKPVIVVGCEFHVDCNVPVVNCAPLFWAISYFKSKYFSLYFKYLFLNIIYIYIYII